MGIQFAYPVIDIGTAANNHAVVDNAHLAVHIQLLLDDIVFLSLRIALPDLIDHLATVQHRSVSHRVTAPLALLCLALFDLFLELLQLAHSLFFLFPSRVGFVVLFISIALLANRRVHTLAHDGLCNTTLNVLVVDTSLRLELFEGGSLVDSVIRTQSENKDLFCVNLSVSRHKQGRKPGRTRGINTSLLDLTHDGVLAAADRLVLVVHDGPSARCRRIAQVTSKPGNGGDDDDDTELTSLFTGTNAGIDDSTTDLVVNRMLLVSGGSDWKTDQ